MPPFDRRDSGAAALAAGLLVATLAALAAPSFGWPVLATAAPAGLVALIALGAALRHLPPDIALHPLEAAEMEAALGPPPPHLARLRIGLAPEPLGWSRLDILVDGRRAGQLRPGTAFVMPLSPALHDVSAKVWLRALPFHYQVNALPGTDTDILIRSMGGRARQYAADRHGLDPLLRDRRLALVRPDPG